MLGWQYITGIIKNNGDFNWHNNIS